MRKLIALLVVCAGLFSLTGPASAAPAVDGIFDLPQPANRLALGADGNIWVPLASADPNIARVAPDGTVTPFTVKDQGSANLNSPIGIVGGPDGKLWVTGNTYVASFAPSSTAANKTTIGTLNQPQGITVGQDGNLWTGSGANVFKIPPSNPTGFTSIPTGIAGFDAREITSATDGKLWVANAGAPTGILPVTLAGTVGPQVLASANPGGVQGVAAGPNGQVAYSNPNTDPQEIGLINNGVGAAPFKFPAPADPNGVLYGQDGVYWIGQSNPSIIGRYSTAGSYSKFADMPANSFPRKLVRGVGGTIWVILERPGELFSRIARISGVEPPATGGGDTFPKVTALKISPNKFKVGKSKTPLVVQAMKKTPTGTTIKYSLDKPATVFIDIRQKVRGKKSGTKCVKPTKKLRKKKNCTRTVTKGTLRRLGVTGANSVKFSGRLNKTKLKPGKYEVRVTAFADVNGTGSVPATKSFTIVRK